MKTRFQLLCFFVMIFSVGGVFGQGLDTLGLTGTVGDTVVADRLFGEMKGLMTRKKWENAEAKGEQAKAIYVQLLGEESKQVADVWHRLGFIGYYTNNNAVALECWEKALAIRIKVLGIKHLDVGKSYNNVGLCYSENNNDDKALEYYQKALNIRLELLGAEHPDVAEVYNNIGTSYDAKGEYNKAIDFHQKCLKIWLKSFGLNNPDVAGSFNNLGECYQNIGDYNKAIESHQNALNIRIKLFGLNHPAVADSYNSLGVDYGKQGDADKSIDYLQKALDIRIKALGPDHLYVARSINNLGNAFEDKGDYDKSIACNQKALKIRLKNLGSEHPDVATSYNNLGNAYHSLDLNDSAIEYHNKALAIWLKTIGSEDFHVAFAYSNLGNCYASKNMYNKALEYQLKSLAILVKANGVVNPQVASSSNSIGNSYLHIPDYDKAKDYYANALNACFYHTRNLTKVNSLETLISALYGLGSTLKKQYIQTRNAQFLSESDDYARQTLTAIYFQQSIFENNTKALWKTKNYIAYEQAISISLLKASVDQNDTLRHHAFTYAEKSKASLLQAQIKEASAFSQIPDSLLQQEHDLRIDITWREKQRQALLDMGLSETDTNTLRISSIIFDLKRDYEALKLRFEKDYPKYYNAKYDLSTVSLAYVQDTLLQPHQALLEYFVGDSSIFLFVVRPDTMIVREVPRDFPLDDWIEQFRHGLYGFYTAPEAEQTDALKTQCITQYLEYAPKLYQKLFAPVKELLPEQDALIVVPDGPLGYIPFDALLTAAPKVASDFKNYPYLLRKYQFSYTYSATLLKEMRDKKHRHEPSKLFAAFAPFYTGDTLVFTQDYSYVTRKNFDPLPYSKEEVGQARKKLGGDIVSGLAATEARFMEMAGDYRILHLATHGVADNRVGDYAYLAFSEIKDSIENELLYVKDLYNLELNADLVVLSACETGVGKLQRGEGIISLARAFAYAGAKSIVTSLWSVNDRSTSELMSLFYTELKAGKTKDKALHDARLAFLKTDNVRICHPFFWAAFVPVGDMQAVNGRR